LFKGELFPWFIGALFAQRQKPVSASQPRCGPITHRLIGVGAYSRFEAKATFLIVAPVLCSLRLKATFSMVKAERFPWINVSQPLKRFPMNSHGDIFHGPKGTNLQNAWFPWLNLPSPIYLATEKRWRNSGLNTERCRRGSLLLEEPIENLAGRGAMKNVAIATRIHESCRLCAMKDVAFLTSVPWKTSPLAMRNVALV
jgi:hypothetical protein